MCSPPVYIFSLVSKFTYTLHQRKCCSSQLTVNTWVHMPILPAASLGYDQTSTAQHSTAQHGTAQHGTAQHGTAQHSMAQHMAQHGAAQHGTAQHSTIRHGTAQHSTAQPSHRCHTMTATTHLVPVLGCTMALNTCLPVHISTGLRMLGTGRSNCSAASPM